MEDIKGEGLLGCSKTTRRVTRIARKLGPEGLGNSNNAAYIGVSSPIGQG